MLYDHIIYNNNIFITYHAYDQYGNNDKYKSKSWTKILYRTELQNYYYSTQIILVVRSTGIFYLRYNSL